MSVTHMVEKVKDRTDRPRSRVRITPRYGFTSRAAMAHAAARPEARVQRAGSSRLAVLCGLVGDASASQLVASLMASTTTEGILAVSTMTLQFAQA